MTVVDLQLRKISKIPLSHTIAALRKHSMPDWCRTGLRTASHYGVKEGGMVTEEEEDNNGHYTKAAVKSHETIGPREPIICATAL